MGLPVLQESQAKLVESREMMSTFKPADVTPAAPATGADLRLARERLGWTLADVAQSLRIRTAYLEALEAGQLSILPGNAYALAFVRSYAQLLGLDAEETVRRFKAEAADVSRRTELAFPVPMPERGLPAGAIMLLGLILVVVAYAGWYRLSGAGRAPAEAVVSVPERLAAVADLTAPRASTAMANAAPQGQADAGKGDGKTPDALGVMQPLPTGTASIGTPAGDIATATGMPAVRMPPAALAPVPNQAVATSPLSAAAAPAPAPADDTDPVGEADIAPAAAESRIVLQAKADAWILVKDRSGAVLLNRVLKSGETWPVPARSDLVMTTGNAGGTEVLVDGTAMPALGGSGVVRRDIALDPDALKAGRQTIAVAVPAARAR